MRDLTQQEIDDAPEWATHYVIDKSGYVIYESEYHLQFSNSERRCDSDGLTVRSQPIIRNEFDISEYEFDNMKFIRVDIDDEPNFGGSHHGDEHYITKKVEALEADNSALKSDNALLTHQLNNAIAAMEKKR